MPHATGVPYRPSVATLVRGTSMRQQVHSDKTYGIFAPDQNSKAAKQLQRGTVYKREPSDWNPKKTGPASRSDEDRLEEIRKWAHADIAMWEPRNTRFRRDQDLFQANVGSVGERNQYDKLVLPDPKILIKKVARIIARHPNVIEVPPSPDAENPAISQYIENFLYQWDQQINQKWMMGLNNPYRYDQAQMLAMRGWMAERTLFVPEGKKHLDSDPSALWDHQVIDPALVYPKVSGNQVVRVTHAFQSTVGEMYYDPILTLNKAPEAWDDMEPSTMMNVTAVYWMDRDRTWWHAVIATPFAKGRNDESEFLKKPVELGYNPWTILTANGASWRNTPWEATEWVAEIGTGLLDESATMYQYINRMTTKLNELLSLEANPPAAIYVENGEIKSIDLAPGGRNFFNNREDKIELLRTGPRTDTYNLLFQILDQRLSRGTVPPSFFSEGPGDGGFGAAVTVAAGKDVLYPLVETINQMDSLKYRKVLELYRDFGPSKALKTVKEDGDSRSISAAEITAKDIKDQGTLVNITREDMSPQEYGARINLGLAMIARDAISMETFRRDYAKLRNPRAENRQILAEKVYMSEDVIKALIPAALEGTGMPELRALWEKTQNPTPPAGALPGMPGMPPGAPPGMPPGMPPGLPNMQGLPAMPMQQPGMPPPQMNTGLDPMTALMQDPMIMAMLSGGAQGGLGMGGTPPPPGFGPQVPPMGMAPPMPV